MVGESVWPYTHLGLWLNDDDSDNNSEARMKVKEESRKVSNTQESGSNSDTGSYEDKSDREWGGEAESTSSVETSDGIFSMFVTWLQTADGGRKPEKMSKQHASQLNKMLSVVDPNKDLASLFNRKLVRDTFLRRVQHTFEKYNLFINHFETHITPDCFLDHMLKGPFISVTAKKHPMQRCNSALCNVTKVSYTTLQKVPYPKL